MTTDIDNERKSRDGYRINCVAHWMGRLFFRIKKACKYFRWKWRKITTAIQWIKEIRLDWRVLSIGRPWWDHQSFLNYLLSYLSYSIEWSHCHAFRMFSLPFNAISLPILNLSKSNNKWMAFLCGPDENNRTRSHRINERNRHKEFMQKQYRYYWCGKPDAYERKSRDIHAHAHTYTQAHTRNWCL